jgi:hypothetical protein
MKKRLCADTIRPAAGSVKVTLVMHHWQRDRINVLLKITSPSKMITSVIFDTHFLHYTCLNEALACHSEAQPWGSLEVTCKGMRVQIVLHAGRDNYKIIRASATT